VCRNSKTIPPNIRGLSEISTVPRREMDGSLRMEEVRVLGLVILSQKFLVIAGVASGDIAFLLLLRAYHFLPPLVGQQGHVLFFDLLVPGLEAFFRRFGQLELQFHPVQLLLRRLECLLLTETQVSLRPSVFLPAPL